MRAATGGAEVDLLLLEHALRAMDRLEGVRMVLDREGLTVEGSKGQTRPHPLLVAEGVLRREVAASLERLGIGPTPGRQNWMSVRRGRLRSKYPDC